jgi:hypothetical protein
MKKLMISIIALIAVISFGTVTVSAQAHGVLTKPDSKKGFVYGHSYLGGPITTEYESYDESRTAYVGPSTLFYLSADVYSTAGGSDGDALAYASAGDREARSESTGGQYVNNGTNYITPKCNPPGANYAVPLYIHYEVRATYYGTYSWAQVIVNW